MLVPKFAHANKVNDYQPISCCNVFHKVIFKLLASRIAVILDSILHEDQIAFVKGRLFSNYIHLAQVLLRDFNRKRSSPRCILKVDLQKAFYLVHWDFVHVGLLRLQFLEQFVP